MIDRRVFLFGALASLAACRTRQHSIIVGSKNFTEQLLLGEILAQTIEANSPEQVGRRFYLAGTYICHQALLAGRIDLYPEYTGTALTAILKEKPQQDATQVFEQVRDEYRRRFGLEVLPPLGFNNSFAMVMRGEDARQLNVAKLSQLARVSERLRMGVGYEFVERPDGYKGLVAKYGLKFREEPRVMDLGLLYRALQNGQVDVVAGSNTDGLISALKLTVLEDDWHYFPPYDAVVIVRPAALNRNSSVRNCLQKLSGQLTAEEMRRLNFAVDGEKKDAEMVVREFLRTQRFAAVG